jgi:mycothiol synthase
MGSDFIKILNAPAIDGLCFRHFRGPEDFPKMVEVCNASLDADKADRTTTLEDITNDYAHLVNCDPDRDMIFAEVYRKSSERPHPMPTARYREQR